MHLVFLAHTVFIIFFFQISNFFGPSTTEETLVVEMLIWCIKIGIILDLHVPYIQINIF
jgi:hypothetical protein